MASDSFLYIKTINMDFTMRDKYEAEVASLLEAPDITCFYDFMFHQSYIVYSYGDQLWHVCILIPDGCYTWFDKEKAYHFRSYR